MIRRKATEVPASPMQQVVKSINREIVKRNLSIGQLAEQSGCGRAYLYRVLQGEQSPTLQWIDKILAALEMSVKLVRDK